MALLETILGGNVGKLVKDVVGAFKLDPEKKAEFQAAIDANAAAIALKQLELQEHAADAVSKEVEIASANIRAESIAGDKYTGRARPTFLYMMEFILFCNYVVMPLINTHNHPHAPVEFPDALFWLFGSCMLGYTGARTWEKVSGVKDKGKTEDK